MRFELNLLPVARKRLLSKDFLIDHVEIGPRGLKKRA